MAGTCPSCMMRPVVAGALLIAVLVGGFFIGAVHIIAGETWPEWF